MYPAPFAFHRVSSVQEAVSLLAELGTDAKFLSGGQSLIPLLKLRLDAPSNLVDISRIPDLSDIAQDGDVVNIGALATHADIAKSNVAASIPIIGDCAGGIADAQIRSRGTIGGSLAEADPGGDWAPIMLLLDGSVTCVGPGGTRTLAVDELIEDAFTTRLEHGEMVTQVHFKVPPASSGGAYIAFKRAAPAYPTATAGVQLTVSGDTCVDAGVVLGSTGLKAARVPDAEALLRGNPLSTAQIDKAAAAAYESAEPLPDLRGSEDYKRTLLRALVKRATGLAARRAAGEQIEGSHNYV